MRGLVLVDGFVDLSSPQLRDSMNAMLEKFQADRNEFTQRFVRSMYASNPPEAYIQRIIQESMKTPANSAVLDMRSVLSHGDFTGILEKVDRPVLYICQPQLEFESKIVRAKLPNARVEVFQNVSHALFVDDPAHFNRVVGEFVDSLSKN